MSARARLGAFVRPRPGACAALLALLCPLAACAGGEADGSHGHGEEEHGHGHGAERAADGAEKTDAHHLAEDRVRCEDDVALAAEALAAYGIRVEPVREMVLLPTLSAPGHLAFPQGAVARVGTAVRGRVVELAVRSGDAVSKGEALLVLESSELGEAQSEYLRKRTLAAAAEPALELAREALGRARELYDRVQGIALAEVQQREADLRAAERDREVARADEAAARNRLLLFGMDEPAIRALEESGALEPRLVVTAPIDGRIVEVAATLGELVGPEHGRLLVIGDPRTLWAIAEVSEARLAEVAVGAAARVTVPALGPASSAGRVAALATVLEASTRTAEVRIELENPDGTLLPGMFVQVEIESSRGAGTPTLAVPDGAVLTIEGRPSVFVPVEQGGAVFCRHPVEVGAPIGDQVPVLAGLERGDLVVVAGTFRLKAEHGKASAEHGH